MAAFFAQAQLVPSYARYLLSVFFAPVRQNPNTVPSALPFSRIDHAAERTQTNWVATLRHKAPFTVPGGAAAHDLFGALCTERETEVARRQACLPTLTEIRLLLPLLSFSTKAVSDPGSSGSEIRVFCPFWQFGVQNSGSFGQKTL